MVLLRFFADDHSRVKMTEDPNKEGSDYINANLIDVSKAAWAIVCISYSSIIIIISFISVGL